MRPLKNKTLASDVTKQKNLGERPSAQTVFRRDLFTSPSDFEEAAQDRTKKPWCTHNDDLHGS